jgi:serine/threonine protein kinase
VQADLSTREIELAALHESLEAERKQLAELSEQVQERETFLRAARKQFQSTLEEFRADQRRFRLATSSVKGHRERSRRRRETAVVLKNDQEWGQVLGTEGVLSVPQAQWFEDGRFGNFVLGDYRIGELLSIGANEWVYEAGDLKDSSRVAIKALCHERSSDPAAITRLENEARIGGTVVHRNILKTLWFVNSEQTSAYLVMDLIDGVTLGELIAVHGKLPWREVCNYIFQAAIGLQALHDAGIVHRDVQPSNLLIERTGGLKVGDFGSATTTFVPEQALRIEGDDRPPGAIDYAAPEVFDHDLTTGARADLYSLGCTFYYALTGTVPFPDYDDAEKIHAHRTLPPQPIRSSASHVPAEIIGLVRKLMAKDPKKRPDSMQEVTRALSGLARPQPAYFDRYAILMQRSVMARGRLRERAKQLAERTKSIETSTAPSS